MIRKVLGLFLLTGVPSSIVPIILEILMQNQASLKRSLWFLDLSS
jgi:hypothetical protein